jgi:hypothetical protein
MTSWNWWRRLFTRQPDVTRVVNRFEDGTVRPKVWTDGKPFTHTQLRAVRQAGTAGRSTRP